MTGEFARPDIVGIVPAAGRGVRVGDLGIPKELLPIGFDFHAGRTGESAISLVIDDVIRNMTTAEVRKILVVVSSEKFAIVRHLSHATDAGARIAYVIQEEPQGVPQACLLTHPWAGNSHCLLGFPDTLVRPRDAMAQLLCKHQTELADLTLGLFPSDTPHRFGTVWTEGDCIVRIIDKPQIEGREFVWGCAVWGPRFWTVLEASIARDGQQSRELTLSDCFTAALNAGLTVRALHFPNGGYADIGEHVSYVACLRSVLAGLPV